jgi:hypothetical protein
LFDEPALQSGLLLVAKIRNEKGEIVGFAVEAEAMDAASNPLLGKMRMNTDWTIVLPARGTIYVAQIEDSGAIGKDILPAVMLGQEWNGKVDFVSTVGPDPSGRGVIIGGTREFQGITGSFVELSHLAHMSRTRGGVGSFELQDLRSDLARRAEALGSQYEGHRRGLIQAAQEAFVVVARPFTGWAGAGKWIDCVTPVNYSSPIPIRALLDKPSWSIGRVPIGDQVAHARRPLKGNNDDNFCTSCHAIHTCNGIREAHCRIPADLRRA